MDFEQARTLDFAAPKPKLYHVGTLSYTKAGLFAIFFWLLWGDLCFMVMENVVPTILPLKLEEFGAPNWAVGMVISTLPQLINLFMNPFISFKSDRYRSPRGRRIPFITATMPILVLLLLGVGYGDVIGPLLTRHNSDRVSLVAISMMMILFSIANMFVNCVFWYLFNDVIPEQFLARFMSMFRTVALSSTALYSFFIFPFAGEHSHEIFIGAALLYLFGFGLMCFKVKEGEYPPAPEYVDGRSGVISAVKTYGTECYSLWHYLCLFLVAVGMGGVTVCNNFVLFFYESTGLNLTHIGIVTGTSLIATSVMILGTGWLADRYHPIRVVIAGLLLQLLVATPATMLWLFWHPGTQTSYVLWMVITIALIAPAMALWSMLDPPLFMRIFPRDRYGQFCSANAIVRAVSIAVNGMVVGFGLDMLAKYFGQETARRCLPIWQLVSFGVMLVGMVLLYRSWKHYGGDEAYVPPIRSRAGVTQVSG